MRISGQKFIIKITIPCFYSFLLYVLFCAIEMRAGRWSMSCMCLLWNFYLWNKVVRPSKGKHINFRTWWMHEECRWIGIYFPFYRQSQSLSPANRKSGAVARGEEIVHSNIRFIPTGSIASVLLWLNLETSVVVVNTDHISEAHVNTYI